MKTNSKRLVSILLIFLAFGVVSAFAQSNTCTLVGSGSGWQVWRDDNNGRVWVAYNNKEFVINFIRTEINRAGRQAYEIACTGGVRKVVDSASAILTIASALGYSIPPASATYLWSALCYIAD